MSRRGSLICALSLSLALAACGLLQPRPRAPGAEPVPFVTPFSSASLQGAWPRGWFPAAAPKFRTPTRYESVDDAGTTVVHARGGRLVLRLGAQRGHRPAPLPDPALALESATADPRCGQHAARDRRRACAHPTGLRRRRVLAAVRRAPVLHPSEGDRRLRRTLRDAGVLLGGGAPAGGIVVNQWTRRIRGVLVRSGPPGMGRWVFEESNVYEDFRAAFGEEPGRITQKCK